MYRPAQTAYGIRTPRCNRVILCTWQKLHILRRKRQHICMHTCTFPSRNIIHQDVTQKHKTSKNWKELDTFLLTYWYLNMIIVNINSNALSGNVTKVNGRQSDTEKDVCVCSYSCWRDCRSDSPASITHTHILITRRNIDNSETVPQCKTVEIGAVVSH